jgi:hypothetical protein
MPTGALLDASGQLSPAWAVWFTRTHVGARSIQEAGTTAERPTTQLWIGRRYFDTSLGKPVWVKLVPAKPAAAVWVDAAGVVV